MSRIRVVSLYSGSGGNSTLVETSKGSILIDAGKSARALCAALRQVGSDASRINAVFVTHEHTDHVSALEIFLKKNAVPVHITRASADNLHTLPDSRLSAALKIHTPVFSEKVADMTVSAFPVSHDSAMCVGYRIETDDGYSVGIATDTGYVTDEMMTALTGCRAVIVESNHSEEMLMCGHYPADLKRRILSRRGHLSNNACADVIGCLAASGTTDFMLAHLSRDNNCPDCALSSARDALSDYPNTRLCAAKPESETVFVNLEL